MSQTIRIGPQDAKKPISLEPGDTLEVALPEKSVGGTWKVDFDRSLLWDEEEDAQQARWVLGGAHQQTVRNLLALAKGSCILRCAYLDLRNGGGRVLEDINFTIYVGIKASERKKYPPKKAAPASVASRASRQASHDVSDAAHGSQSRLQHLETENRRLQERLWDLTNKVVQLAEDYAAIVKGKATRNRPGARR
ncbi:MAG: hypothetical protein GTO55_12025 [Armatimonadetes bacterium]|nr:hypothetical protein [Armatimonadota bacterium]NIM24940.1 hypothetical protein [Armatimonadota bacterium]NIM68826.1 hypothetical protein [Armatimonadota bacterium]NIM77073.1 hypothetical protein [Armatimonadota bacterium]NIN07031.1 hypothetical protein [Armatimonadota bacterium]